jgi:uncharacterized protein (UPF0332 family)
MTGRDFVACAERLSQSVGEADLRSAISRAYYGAFHYVRAALSECGVQVPKTEQVHVKMEFCLRGCGDPIAAHAGQQLERLRARRKAADYDLDDTRYITASAAQAEIRRALEIHEAIENCLTSSTSGFRAKIRVHARLLGLAISD